MARYFCTRSVATLIVVTSTALAGSPVSGTEIGSVTAANPRIDGAPPNQPPRILEMGNRVFADELIVTSEIGSGQFVFLDQTTLTVSPGSEIVLDRYIFDPDTGSGEIALTLTKGVLRFIGGRVTKTGEAVVMTPHATIGIRGGIVAITVGQEGTNAVFLAGLNMCTTGKIQRICVTRPGGMVTVKAAPPSGEPGSTAAAESDAAGDAGDGSGEPVYQGVASAEQIGQIYESTNTGGTGGTTQPIGSQTVDTLATTSGLTNIGAESPGAATQPPVSTTGQEAPPEPTTSETEAVSDVRTEPENTAASQPPETIISDFMGGIKSDISTLGTMGEATYDGVATASITEIGGGGVANFSDSGRILMTYDFGSRSGAATITGIADTTFTSTISQGAAASGAHFGGTLLDTSSFSQVGSIDGSFFTNGPDTSAATAGAFDFARQLDGGVMQSGSGDFSAKKVAN